MITAAVPDAKGDAAMGGTVWGAGAFRVGKIEGRGSRFEVRVKRFE
jgi:hypothetical protein